MRTHSRYCKLLCIDLLIKHHVAASFPDPAVTAVWSGASGTYERFGALTAVARHSDDLNTQFIQLVNYLLQARQIVLADRAVLPAIHHYHLPLASRRAQLDLPTLVKCRDMLRRICTFMSKQDTAEDKVLSNDNARVRLTRWPHLDGVQRDVRQLLPGDNDASACGSWWTTLPSPRCRESLQNARSLLLLLRASIGWSPGCRLPGRAHEGQNVHHCTRAVLGFPCANVLVKGIRECWLIGHS